MSLSLPRHLLPRGDVPAGEDEDDGDDIQRPPDEERQGSSAAPHRGQPGQADQQGGAQAQDHAQHRQGADVGVDVLETDGGQRRVRGFPWSRVRW